MKKREISAIDSIYEILERIENIEKHYELLNKQLSMVNNKLKLISDFIFDENIHRKKSSSEAISEVKKASNIDKEEASFVAGKIKVFSFILDKDRVPIDNVNIKIFNSKKANIRDLLTDKDGYWEARLPKGKYLVTMNHANFKTIERRFFLNGDTDLYEVK